MKIGNAVCGGDGRLRSPSQSTYDAERMLEFWVFATSPEDSPTSRRRPPRAWPRGAQDSRARAWSCRSPDVDPAAQQAADRLMLALAAPGRPARMARRLRVDADDPPVELTGDNRPSAAKNYWQISPTAPSRDQRALIGGRHRVATGPKSCDGARSRFQPGPWSAAPTAPRRTPSLDR